MAGARSRVVKARNIPSHVSRSNGNVNEAYRLCWNWAAESLEHQEPTSERGKAAENRNLFVGHARPNKQSVVVSKCQEG